MRRHPGVFSSHPAGVASRAQALAARHWPGRLLALAFLFAAHCSPADGPPATAAADPSAAAPVGRATSALDQPDAGGPATDAGGPATDAGGTGYVPPGSDDTPLVHAAATPIAVTVLPGPAANYLDVGADLGGNVWALDWYHVYFWNQSNILTATLTQTGSGLARGNGSFRFASVAGGLPGEAIVGNRGAIADHVVLDPSSGALLGVDNMTVPVFDGPEYQEHVVRVVAGIRVVADPNGTWNGTAYIGGTHGTTAWHGVAGDCGCVQFEEHMHYIPDNPGQCDSTGPQGGCWGGDVYGLALTPTGDVWMGDEHFVALQPQLSRGPSTDFFTKYQLAIDVFPNVNDEVHALSVDADGGLWVASFGQGLAYLAPMTYQPSYFDRSRELPQNRVTAVAVDTDGSVWVGTIGGGIARKTDAGWVYYTQASGLPSNGINSIFIDSQSTPRRVLIGTDYRVGVYTGP